MGGYLVGPEAKRLLLDLGRLTSGVDYEQRVAAADWNRIGAELATLGRALIGPLLSPDESAGLAKMYPDGSRRTFSLPRSTLCRRLLDFLLPNVGLGVEKTSC